MKYIITENQLSKLISKYTQTPEDKSYRAKVSNFFGGSDQSSARVIYQGIKDGKAEITNFTENNSIPLFQSFDFSINDFPFKISREENLIMPDDKFSYEIYMPIFKNENLNVTTYLLNKIFEKLLEQYNQN
jgi:hypothetical protein